MDDLILKEELKQFGDVTQCGEIYNEFHIVIKEGFDNKAHVVNKAMKIIKDTIGEEFTKIVKCYVQENHFQFVLKR